MINENKGNLFELVQQQCLNNGDIHIIVHGCNAQGRMKSGFAKELRERFEGAYDAYYNAYIQNHHHLKLGSNILFEASNELIICNSITQDLYGYDGEKYVSYDAIDAAFKELDTIASLIRFDMDIQVHIHFPKIGSDLGGGEWDVISQIIDHRVQNATKNLYVL